MRDTAPGSRGFDSKGEPDGAETSGSRSTPLHAARTSIYPTCGVTRSAPGLHHSRTQVGDRSGVRRIWLKMFDVGWPFVTQGRPSMRWRCLGAVCGSSGLRAHGRAWLSHGGRRLIYDGGLSLRLRHLILPITITRQDANPPAYVDERHRRAGGVAVCALMTSSNLFACTTGEAATLTPLRMRPCRGPLVDRAAAFDWMPHRRPS